MNEEEARASLKARFGSAKLEILMRLVELITAESTRQNLVAPSTIPTMWNRHVLDSAQLIDLTPRDPTSWMDIGSGAGFPGLVVAALLESIQVTLVEPRRRRAEFLNEATTELGLTNVEICSLRVEQLPANTPSVISARAVASLSDIFTLTTPHRGPSTVYVLPKGASGVLEVEQARGAWQGVFHVEQSATDAASTIIVAREVTARCFGLR